MLPDITLHIPAMRRYALVLTRDRHRVEDLVQESLARALAAHRTWKPGSNMRTWLLSIVHNSFVSGWRRERVELSALDGAAAALPPGAGPARPDMQVEVQQVIDRLLALPDGMREILLLAVVEEMSYREIAEMLGIPMGTVMSRLARARAALREQVEGAAVPTRRPALKLVE
ncbi:sigma-70 family RNA polymerase sigma factor [Niveispirillum fermenti]|uniref:sigma-70 family RNA polymerase sigma factor n=1 Tax=Niveispirillum fermenti TaxID=1233113 RepID=UPI003A891BC6